MLGAATRLAIAMVAEGRGEELCSMTAPLGGLLVGLIPPPDGSRGASGVLSLQGVREGR
jgi:hypothetical protein